jgi:hypothetical protein
VRSTFADCLLRAQRAEAFSDSHGQSLAVRQPSAFRDGVAQRDAEAVHKSDTGAYHQRGKEIADARTEAGRWTNRLE